MSYIHCPFAHITKHLRVMQLEVACCRHQLNKHGSGAKVCSLRAPVDAQNMQHFAKKCCPIFAIGFLVAAAQENPYKGWIFETIVLMQLPAQGCCSWQLTCLCAGWKPADNTG